MKLAVVCSGGGATIQYAVEIWRKSDRPLELCMVTDRACQAEDVASTLKLIHRRISEKDAREFTKQTFLWFCEQKTDSCLLLFSRLISAELYERMPVFNIHPSLLPEFPGFKAVERAFLAKKPQLGATLHQVDATVDGGTIVAQLASEMKSNAQIDYWLRVSFAQKVYLTLLWFEITLGYSVKESSKLSAPIELLFREFLYSEAIEWSVR